MCRCSCALGLRAVRARANGGAIQYHTDNAIARVLFKRRALRANPASTAGVRASPLLFTRISALTGRGAASLSSFGGEGQGEEAVFHQPAKAIATAASWHAATIGSFDNGPPLPSPLLQRRRGRRTTSSLFDSVKCV